MLLVTVFDMLDSWCSFILWAGAVAQFHTFRYVFDTLGRRLGAISYLFDISPYFWPAPWRGPIFVHMLFHTLGRRPSAVSYFSIRVLYYGPPPSAVSYLLDMFDSLGRRLGAVSYFRYVFDTCWLAP
jgi:hypothetical protein